LAIEAFLEDMLRRSPGARSRIRASRPDGAPAMREVNEILKVWLATF